MNTLERLLLVISDPAKDSSPLVVFVRSSACFFINLSLLGTSCRPHYHPTLSANASLAITSPRLPSSLRPHAKRRDSFSLFVLMSLSFGGLGIMSMRRTYSNWSDIVQGSGEVKSLFFGLLVIIVVLILGEF